MRVDTAAAVGKYIYGAPVGANTAAAVRGIGGAPAGADTAAAVGK